MKKILSALKNLFTPPAPKTHAVFYFPMDHARMGIQAAYFLAVPLKEDGHLLFCVYSGCESEEDMVNTQADNLKDGKACVNDMYFVRTNVGMDDPVIERHVVNGHTPIEKYRVGQTLDLGMGNWGTALGKFHIIRKRQHMGALQTETQNEGA